MSNHFPPCRYSGADCEGHNCGMGCAESDAEQRLHNAAPDMLRLLEKFVTWHDDLHIPVSQARVIRDEAFEIIRKAQGKE